MEQKKPVVLSTWNFGLLANAIAYPKLVDGARALDAIELGVRAVEDDPSEHTVGFGGRPDRDGKVTLDACVMDENFNIGCVAALEHIRHPVSVARAVMETSPHVMLVGDGCLQFALENGFSKENLLLDSVKDEWHAWLVDKSYTPVVNIENHDTISSIALDIHGNLSGVCTTSGMAFKMSGRVGDSPIIGAGLYVDNDVGAAAATGHGEEVVRMCGSHVVVELMRQGHSPQAACRMAIDRVISASQRRGLHLDNIQVGFIALNKAGEHGAFAIHKGFTYAVASVADHNSLYDSEYMVD
jgi:N4-(beta-N-acetylglucosaminyl)-L-asparaginase